MLVDSARMTTVGEKTLPRIFQIVRKPNGRSERNLTIVVREATPGG